MSPYCGAAKTLAVDATYRRAGVRGLPSAAKVLAGLTDAEITAALEALHGDAITGLQVARPVAAEAAPEAPAGAPEPEPNADPLAVGGIVAPFPDANAGAGRTGAGSNGGARLRPRMSAA